MTDKGLYSILMSVHINIKTFNKKNEHKEFDIIVCKDLSQKVKPKKKLIFRGDFMSNISFFSNKKGIKDKTSTLTSSSPSAKSSEESVVAKRIYL